MQRAGRQADARWSAASMDRFVYGSCRCVFLPTNLLFCVTLPPRKLDLDHPSAPLAASLSHIPSRDSRCATHHQHQTATLPYASARNIRSTARSRHPQPSPSPAATQLGAGPKRAKPATVEEASRHPFGLGKVGRSRIANRRARLASAGRYIYLNNLTWAHTAYCAVGMVSVWQNDTQFMHNERDITPHTLDTFWLRKQGRVPTHPP
ncbi:hypothetical protein VTG60DRAFT_2876 [Thermothelomyces hinnuleus]